MTVDEFKQLLQNQSNGPILIREIVALWDRFTKDHKRYNTNKPTLNISIRRYILVADVSLVELMDNNDVFVIESFDVDQSGNTTIILE